MPSMCRYPLVDLGCGRRKIDESADTFKFIPMNPWVITWPRMSLVSIGVRCLTDGCLYGFESAVLEPISNTQSIALVPTLHKSSLQIRIMLKS
ncbi:hypothetical protein Trydic_g23323 [Trypoxylus dichotomus]